MTDIVKRLRSSDVFIAPMNIEDVMISPVAMMAADEIERLREERDRLANDLAQAHRDILPWLERAGRLTGENDRLRAALRQAEEGLRDAGAIYGADAVRAALGEAG
jgi:hypothetical protein